MDVLDFHAQHHLRSIIDRRCGSDQRRQLKSLRLCGQRTNPKSGGVMLMSNGEGAAGFVGQVHCKNPFACPTCSAKMMEHYRARIASAIELLHRDYFGFMVTVGLPHAGFMSCAETTDILYDTWKYWHRTCYGKKSWHVYTELNKRLPIRYWVRVAEHTWSKKNSWHPHFHCIWWVSRRDEGFKDVLDEFEPRLNEQFYDMSKRAMIDYWTKHNLHADKLAEGETLADLAERVFAGSKAAFERGEVQSVNFARDEKGEIREVDTSDYICGWGADNEVTGNKRKEASHEGHMTPYQILLASESDPELEKVYLRFCLDVTRKPVHHRVNFSKNGLCKMIDDYQREHKVMKRLLEKKIAAMEFVAFFSKEQWWNLCYLDRDAPVIANVLYLSRYKEHRRLLFEYLDYLGVGYTIEGSIAEIWQRWLVA